MKACNYINKRMLTKDVNKYVLVSALYCTIKNEYCTF